MFELKGKVALVTGAASGIGLALVKQLLQNALQGVAMVDSNADLGQVSLSKITSVYGKNRAIFILADVTKRDELEGAFEITVKTFKQLDIVINNAGIVHELEWEKCVAVNLNAVILGSNMAMEKYFPKYRSGSEAVILNTASTVGVAPVTEVAIYSTTKSAVIGFTRAMGQERRYKVTKTRVLAICPGLTKTPILNTVMQQQLAEPFFAQFSRYVRTLPLQEPEDVAKEAIEIIKEAPNGSVWVIDDKKRTVVTFARL